MDNEAFIGVFRFIGWCAILVGTATGLWNWWGGEGFHSFVYEGVVARAFIGLFLGYEIFVGGRH